LLQQIKSFIRDTLGMPPAVTVTRDRFSRAPGTQCAVAQTFRIALWLMGPAILGLAIESWEIRDQYHAIGLTAPGNDPITMILMRHGFDVGLMLTGPLLLIGFARLRTRR
jgi:hypothetical protein